MTPAAPVAAPTPSARHRARVWIAACAGILLGLTVLATVRSHALDSLDRAFGREPQDLSEDNRKVAQFWIWVGDVTEPRIVILVVLALALVLLVRGRRVDAAFVLVPVLVTEHLTRALKDLVERQRPIWNEPVEVLTSYSFPSSHSSVAAAAGAVAVVLAVTYLRGHRARRTTVAAAFTGVVLVGADRIFLGVHNLSDVVAGYLLAAVVVLGYLQLAPGPDAMPEGPDGRA